MLLGFLSFKKGIRFDVFLCCFVFFFASALWKNSQILPRCHIFRYASYKNNSLYMIKGIVDNQPLFKNNTLSFIFKAKEIQFDKLKYNTCGNILVYVRGTRDLPKALTRM